MRLTRPITTPLLYAVLPTLMAALLFGLTGCQPAITTDTTTVDDGGRAVVSVPPQPALPVGERELISLNGREVWVAPWPVGKHGGLLRTASIGSGPKTFNPWAAKDSTSGQMGSMLSAGLVTTHPATGEVIPDLAKSITVLPDRRTYRVTLRQGLRWSDGTPLTISDVLYTWNVIVRQGMGNASIRDTTLVDGKFPTIRQIDAHTVEFVTAKPFAPFARRLGTPIAPRHIFKPIIDKGGDVAFSASWGSDLARTNPSALISGGMWLLDEYDPATQSVTFKPNPYYSTVDRKHQQLPYLASYNIRFVNDMNAMALLFEQGQLDIYPVPGQYAAHVRQLKQPEFTLYNLGPSESRTFLMVNLNNRVDSNGQPVVPQPQASWFQNKAFRNALDLALNREDMVANILKGVGQPAFTAESPVSPFIHPELVTGHAQDIPKAKALLRSAGFSWNNRQQLLDKDGNLVRFELLTNSGNDQRENLGVMIAEDLEQLGIQVDFRPVEFNVLIGKLDSGDWGSMIMGLGGGSPLEPHDSANVWKSDGALHLFNQRPRDEQGQVNLNDRYPFEIAIDTLFEQGAQTFDEEERLAIYHEYQTVIADADPLLYLITPLTLVACQNRVQNVSPTPLGGVTHNLESLWIK